MPGPINKIQVRSGYMYEYDRKIGGYKPYFLKVRAKDVIGLKDIIKNGGASTTAIPMENVTGLNDKISEIESNMQHIPLDNIDELPTRLSGIITAMSHIPMNNVTGLNAKLISLESSIAASAGGSSNPSGPPVYTEDPVVKQKVETSFAKLNKYNPSMTFDSSNGHYYIKNDYGICEIYNKGLDIKAIYNIPYKNFFFYIDRYSTKVIFDGLMCMDLVPHIRSNGVHITPTLLDSESGTFKYCTINTVSNMEYSNNKAFFYVCSNSSLFNGNMYNSMYDDLNISVVVDVMNPNRG